mmetsp:Transcript_9131/g.13330  ORF Transcript_9131/g.13330 Transcript_9131/m.13330 type:complete len:345 (-) Transcript_9131:474-1508(-)
MGKINVAGPIVDVLVRKSPAKSDTDVLELDGLYQEHYLKFIQTDQKLSDILEKIQVYESSLQNFMEASAELSKTVSSFYDKPEERGQPAVVQFRVEHGRLTESFDEKLTPLFHRTVRGPVEKDIQADFNQIKELVDGRNDAYAELDSLMKLSKLLTAFRGGSRNHENMDRRIKESKDRLSFLHSEVMQRFDVLERSFGKRLYACIKNLVHFENEYAQILAVSAEKSLKIIGSGEDLLNGEARFEDKVYTPQPALRSDLVNEVETWDEKELLRGAKQVIQSSDLDSSDFLSAKAPESEDGNLKSPDDMKINPATPNPIIDAESTQSSTAYNTARYALEALAQRGE